MVFFFAYELTSQNKEVAGKIRKSGEIPSTVRKFLILVRKFRIFSDLDDHWVHAEVDGTNQGWWFFSGRQRTKSVDDKG